MTAKGAKAGARINLNNSNAGVGGVKNKKLKKKKQNKSLNRYGCMWVGNESQLWGNPKQKNLARK